MKFIGLCVFLLIPYVSYAVEFATFANPFSLAQWKDVEETATTYGVLVGFPHTYEFIITSTSTFQAYVATKRTADPVSMILVKEAERGVTEITRQNGGQIVWQPTRDTRHGVRLQQAPPIQLELQPGIYRYEISNPDNRGRYQVTVGTSEVTTSYLENVKNSFKVHAFYGWGVTALFTWRVFLPLTILFGFGWWWYKRTRKTIHA